MSYVFSKALQKKPEDDKSNTTRKWSVPYTTSVPNTKPQPVAAPRPVNRPPPPVARKPSTGNEVKPEPATENIVKRKPLRSQSVDFGTGPKMGGAFARLQLNLEKDDDTPKSSIYSDAYNQYRIKRSLKEHGCLPKDMRGDAHMKKLSTSNAPITLPKPSKEATSKRDVFSRNRAVTLPANPTSNDLVIENGRSKSLSSNSSVSETLSETFEEEQKLESTSSDVSVEGQSSNDLISNNLSDEAFVEEKASNLESNIASNNVEEEVDKSNQEVSKVEETDLVQNENKVSNVDNEPLLNGNVSEHEEKDNKSSAEKVTESSGLDEKLDTEINSNDNAAIQDNSASGSNTDQNNKMNEINEQCRLIDEVSIITEKEKSEISEKPALNGETPNEPPIEATEGNGSFEKTSEYKGKEEVTEEAGEHCSKEVLSERVDSSSNHIAEDLSIHVSEGAVSNDIGDESSQIDTVIDNETSGEINSIASDNMINTETLKNDATNSDIVDDAETKDDAKINIKDKDDIDISENLKESNTPESKPLETDNTKVEDSEKEKDLNNNADTNVLSEDTVL